MGMNPRTLRPGSTFTPRSISGLALWLDAADTQTLYTTDAGPVTAVSAPTEIAGCVGWYDFSDSSSLAVTSGSIDACNDKSGNGFHLSASSTNRPTLASAVRNGRNAAEFDGVNDLMTATFSGTYTAATVFAVVYPDTAGGGSLGRILTRGSSGLAYDGTNTAFRYNAPFTGATGNSGQRTANGSATQDQWHLASFTWNGGLDVATAIVPYLSGVTSNAALTGTGDAVSTTGINDFILGNRSLADGADRGWDGYVAEIILFNTALSTANRARVEAYLAAKWGISGVHAQATATNDPVGAWLDKSGNGRHATQATAASRPTISATAQNGRGNLTFNGTSGYFRCNSGAAFRARIAYAVVRRTGIPPAFSPIYAQRAVNSTVAANSAQEFYVSSRDGTGKLFGIVGAGGVMRVDGATVTPVNSGVSNLHEGDLLPNTTAFRAIAVQGNITDTIGTQIPFVGLDPFGLARTYPMQLCELLVYDSLLDAAKFRALERYLAAKWGITLAPQVANADAQDWINRVYANGGTVSATTATAVNTFCDSITNAGIRDRFYRLNLFCGNSDASLAAVRTPLYRGPSLGGTQYGNTTDTNNSFGPGDYAENNGLLGNTSTKWLNTGFDANAAGMTAASVHMAIVVPTYSHPASSNWLAISIINAAATLRQWINFNSSVAPTTEVSAYLGQSSLNVATKTIAATNGATISGGMWLANRTSVSDLRLYNGAAEQASNTTNTLTDATLPTLPMSVFARWNGTTTFGHFGARLRAYSVGLGMTAQQVSDFNTAMSALQTALGRT